MKKKSHKFLYIAIIIVLCIIIAGLFLQLRISTYQNDFLQIDSKVKELTKTLNLPLIEEKEIRGRFFLPQLQQEKTLSIPFDYPLDKLLLQIQEELSLRLVKIHQLEEKDSKDQYQILAKVGSESRTTHTLRFILKKIKIALLIDDFGYSKGGVVDAFLEDLNIPFTISVIPGTPQAKSVAEQAHKSGKEVIIHLPMQPKGKFNPDYKWIILDKMSEEEIKSTMKEARKDIPYAVGLNNHMGSLITSEERPMRALLKAVKEEDLFFVDSRTSPDSIAFALAQEMGVKSTSRQVFLDNEKDIDYIKGQFQQLISSAKEKGKTLGMGHIDITTAQALKEIVASLDERKIELVYVSEIVN